MVLPHKGGAGLAKAVEQVVAHVLQAHGRAGGSHDLGAQAVDGGLDDDVCDGKDGALDTGGQANLDDALEGDGVDSKVARGDADDGVGLEQADKECDGARRIGDGRGDSHAGDAPVEHGNKDEVQANIEDGGHGERLERHAGDTDGAEDGGFEVVEQDRGHAQQKDAQVERCERHGLGRDVKRGEHGLGKDLAQRDDDKAHECHKDRGVDGALDHVLVVAADGVGDNHVGAKR